MEDRESKQPKANYSIDYLHSIVFIKETKRVGVKWVNTFILVIISYVIYSADLQVWANTHYTTVSLPHFLTPRSLLVQYIIIHILLTPPSFVDRSLPIINFLLPPTYDWQTQVKANKTMFDSNRTWSKNVFEVIDCLRLT